MQNAQENQKSSRIVLGISEVWSSMVLSQVKSMDRSFLERNLADCRKRKRSKR